MNNYSNPAYPDTDKTICLDFDGVVHSDCLGYHDGTIYGLPIEGAVEAIKEISEHFIIAICTTKARPDRPLVNGETGLRLVVEWLEKYDLRKYIHSISSQKPAAFLYVDDKSWPNGARFDSYRWKCLLHYLRELWRLQ